MKITFAEDGWSEYLYWQTEAGRVYLANSSMEALREAQLAFAGEAERLGKAYHFSTP